MRYTNSTTLILAGVISLVMMPFARRKVQELLDQFRNSTMSKISLAILYLVHASLILTTLIGILFIIENLSSLNEHHHDILLKVIYANEDL